MDMIWFNLRHTLRLVPHFLCDGHISTNKVYETGLKKATKVYKTMVTPWKTNFNVVNVNKLPLVNGFVYIYPKYFYWKTSTAVGEG